MELRLYWQTLKRRWLLAVLPATAVLLIGWSTYEPPAPAYNAGVQFIVSQQPSPAAGAADEQRYYAWLTSEYIVNGLADWVRGGQFATAVSERLANTGMDIPAAAVQGALAADNTRSMLTVSLTYGDADILAKMIEGVIFVLTSQNATALPQLGGETALLSQLGQPVVNQLPSGIRAQLDLPLRILLAIIAGGGLAFLAEYLDPTVRDRHDVVGLGLLILGEIPKR